MSLRPGIMMRQTNPFLDRYRSPLLLLVAATFYIAVHWRALGVVWFELELRGPDDFLRLYEALSLLGGQDWFDLTAHRMTPPAGADIHWSRFVDLPIAALVWMLQLVFDSDTSARLAAIIWPFTLYLAGLFALVNLCRILVPAANPFLVLFFYVLGIATMAETSPGRLDHHNVQILLFVAALTGMVMQSAIRSDFLVAASIVVSLSIGLDSAALFLPLLTLIGVQWALAAESHAPRLMRIGALLVLVSAMVFVTTIPTQKWHVASCDAFSIFYLVALQLLGVAFVGLSLVTSKSVITRLVIGALTGVGAAAVLLWIFPDCATGPYGNISPELEERWLSHIEEARGILQAAAAAPERWLGDLVYIMIILGLAIFVTYKQHRAHPGWIVLLATIVICATGLFFQIRILRTGILAAVPFTVLFATWVWDWVEKQNIQMHLAKIAAVCLICLPFTSFFWFTAGVLLLKDDVTSEDPVANAKQSVRSSKKGCRANSDYVQLRSLPAGIVMSDINSATPILVHTLHTVVSGPYHRNADAILAVTDFFETDETVARKLADEWKVDYVAYCDPHSDGAGTDDVQRLDVRISNGNLPEWLEMLSAEESALKLLRIKK